MCGQVLLCSKINTGTKYLMPLVLNGPLQFLQCFVVMLSIHHLTSCQEVDEENAHLSQNTVNVTFRTDKICLNFILQRDPLWRQCIDCCLVFGVMCAAHILSPVMIQSWNLLSSWYCCRSVNADSMHFALHSGISCFGTLNNRCSVTILCDKEHEICMKWLVSSIIFKWSFSIMRSCTSSTSLSVMMDGHPLRSSCTCHRLAVNCLHQWCTIYLLITLGP